ncbi:MAG: glucosylglycerol-phosphate synthase [Nitriliruptoraceae bacterium]|nr:glucosylglycerol-phosphate synthase [Nitriliruptoraceae bacterium]
MSGSDLVIVYHRQPFEEVEVDGRVEFREHKSPNGIVPTLKSFFQTVDRGSWVAWQHVDELGQEPEHPHVTMDDRHGTYEVSRIGLTPAQVASFYHVTSKAALWPVLHSFALNFDAQAADWETYREVNRLFAEAACEQASDDALIWIHDYNLWLVPSFIRQIKPDAKVAFFHHTPFPSADVFALLPWRDEIVDSLLACDIVGFHIPRYAENFVQVARSLRGAEVAEKVAVEDGLSPHGMALSEPEVTTKLRYWDREVRLDSFPIGTNPTLIRKVLGERAAGEKGFEIANELGDQQLIVSVGRVDYTKGTIETLLAYERLLERRPELHKRIKLMVTSVAPASGMTVYDETRHEIEQQVGRIHGRFATLDWGPIMLFTTPIPFEELLSYYRAADQCWITPLRDGLNLVAKEYVASKDPLEPGVLVLSEFTGCSVELPDAVIANPYSHESLDAAIDHAIDMSVEERANRMARLTASVDHYDIEHWAGHILTQFEALRSR